MYNREYQPRKRKLPLIPYEAEQYTGILGELSITPTAGEPLPGSLESVTLYYTASNIEHDKAQAALEAIRDKIHVEAIEINDLDAIPTLKS